MDEREHYQFVADERELEWFYRFAVPRIERDNVLFLSLSARNKCLTREEREIFMLGRSEMMKKTIIRKNGFSYFLETLYSLECHKKGMLTKARKPYPQKCLRVYWNLNPTSVRKVIFEQQRMINDYTSEMIDASLKGSKAAIDSAFHKMRRTFDATLSLYARNSAERMWIDFELDYVERPSDVKQAALIGMARDWLINLVGPGNFLIISSPGGLHFPIRRCMLRFNPVQLKFALEGITGELGVACKEIERNENLMVVLPGTFAYDQDGAAMTPRVMNKDDFTIENEIFKEEIASAEEDGTM